MGVSLCGGFCIKPLHFPMWGHGLGAWPGTKKSFKKSDYNGSEKWSVENANESELLIMKEKVKDECNSLISQPPGCCGTCIKCFLPLSPCEVVLSGHGLARKSIAYVRVRWTLWCTRTSVKQISKRLFGAVCPCGGMSHIFANCGKADLIWVRRAL